MIPHIIASILEGRVVNGVEPQGVSTQALDVGEFFGDAIEIANAITVGIFKGLGVDFVKNGILQPGSGHLVFLRFFPREGFSFENIVLYVSKSFLFAFFFHHGQKIVQLPEQLGVQQFLLDAGFQINEGGSLGVGAALVDLASGNTVHHHFCQIFPGHGHGFITAGLHVQIGPVFVVMSIAALMVHPCFAEAFFLTLGAIGAAVALIIFDAHTEFCGGVFG